MRKAFDVDDSKEKRKAFDKRKKIIARIEKEFKKKFYIGDVRVNDEEYEMLVEAARNISKQVLSSACGKVCSIVLAVVLVQIGIKKYDGNYWGHASKVLGINLDGYGQKVLGESFIETLFVYRKFIFNVNERVNSILFHSFVSDYYSKGLFELLFQYFVRDLERDINRNDRYQMQSLMETLILKSELDSKEGEKFADQFIKGSQAYKLRHHTLAAIAANKRHSSMRLRRIIRLIDNAFWKNLVPAKPTSRITMLFKEWLDESSSFDNEFRRYQSGEIRNRGKKHFSTPYLFADLRNSKFSVKLPAQIINESQNLGLYWEIKTCERVTTLDAYTYQVLSGFKTEEASCSISYEELFGDIECRLISKIGVVRRFTNLPKGDVRFFDMEGDYAPRLFKIEMCAFTRVSDELESAALIEKTNLGKLMRWVFDFQAGDIVILPDATAMTVGKTFSSGLTSRGKVNCAKYKENNVVIYSNIPELLLILDEHKIRGTLLKIEGNKYRLSDCSYRSFDSRDAKGQKGVLVNLQQFKEWHSNGLKKVQIDIPGHLVVDTYDFVLIKGFEAAFDGAPYVFQERGTVVFPSHIKVKADADKLKDENGFCFELEGNTGVMSVVVNDSIEVLLNIPVVLWSTDKVLWNSTKAGDLWHTDFYKMQKIYLRTPVNKVSLHTYTSFSDLSGNEEQSVKAEPAGNDLYAIDLTRFQSWLTKDVIKHEIYMKVSDTDYRFANVFTKSYVEYLDVTADYSKHNIFCRFNILGKASYFIDVYHKEELIVEKQPLSGDSFVLKAEDFNVKYLKNGQYKFIIYEAEDDESGFGYQYERLIEKRIEYGDKTELTGKFLKIKRIYPLKKTAIGYDVVVSYVVEIKEHCEHRAYEGCLYIGGNPTDTKIRIEFPFMNDDNRFNMYFWDVEEEAYLDFIYDLEKSILVKNEEAGLKSSVKYRRYKVLDYDEYIYRGSISKVAPSSTMNSSNDIRVIERWNDNSGSNENRLIENIGLSVRSCNCLRRAGITTVKQLQERTSRDLFKVRNLGRTQVEEIIGVLGILGIKLKG